MSYGTVISTPEGPSTRKFSFVINKGQIVRRGQFIQLRIPDGELIGRVSDVFKTNRYFTMPESVKEYESSGNNLGEMFPTEEWEYLVAEATALGVFKNNMFADSSIPPSPGVKVETPDENILSRFFGLKDQGLYLGKMPHHEIDIKLDLTKFLQKHLAVLALSGAGKSYLMGVIIEELLKRDPEKGNLAVVVIDPHGEYKSFAEDGNFINKSRVFSSSDIKLGLSEISPYSFRGFIPDLAPAQERELVRIVSELKDKNNTFNMTDLMDSIEKNCKPVIKDLLLSHLDRLKRLKIFDSIDDPSVNSLAVQGELSVVDLSDTTNMKKKQIIVSRIAKKLFDARRAGKIPPFVLIIEEAHQFAPEKMKREEALSRGILTTIAREGRKFGASLCLISQRPKQLSTTALSQCNTQIILRITNPYDLKHIEESSEGITRDVLDRISSLKVGTGLIVGEAVNFPMFINVRKRESKESEKSKNLETSAIEFYKTNKQKQQDAKEFLS
ncbi:MAG: ATP-binding protein [Candidatus Aenigmatarchaeota archaeon]